MFRKIRLLRIAGSLFVTFLLPGTTFVDAATYLHTLRSFGYSDYSGQRPSAALIEATDGAIYGTDYEGGTANSGTIFKVNKNGSSYIVLHHFSGSPLDGRNPQTELIEAVDGKLYGTTSRGGSNDYGTVFRVNKDGTEYAVLHHFTGFGGDGRTPTGLTQGTDEYFYGATSQGGSNNIGTVFRLNDDGSEFQIVHHFTSVYGRTPLATPIEGLDGQLYGTTHGGGSNDLGVVYRVEKNGTGYTVLHYFLNNGFDGRNPQAELLLAGDGYFYGTTSTGGTNSIGTIFKIGNDGSGYEILFDFPLIPMEAVSVRTRLIEGDDGKLYGSSSGLRSSGGLLYRLNKDGTDYGVIHDFDDAGVSSALLLAGNGRLYGASYKGGNRNSGFLFSMDLDGTAYEVLHDFDNTGGDATSPQGLTLVSNQFLFGVANSGGTNNLGAIYRAKRDGSAFTLLHTFSGSGDGSIPVGELVLASDSALYGITQSGGNDNAGTIFKIQQDGSDYLILRSFNTNNDDAMTPAGGLMEGSDGALYGNSMAGGTTGNGTVFKLDKDGSNYLVLHSFDSASGSSPRGLLVEDSEGMLFGTTFNGGRKGLGTVFKLAKDGSNFAILHHFVGHNPAPLPPPNPPVVPDYGEFPAAGLLIGSNETLYGTVTSGGTNASGNSALAGFGALFKMNRDGTEYAILHSFSQTTNGASPETGVVQGRDGALYGTTYEGGAGGVGTIFKINADGTDFSVLHHFNTENGRRPTTGLDVSSDGIFYGTTSSGGQLNVGTLFMLLPPQTPQNLEIGLEPPNLLVTFSGTPGTQYQLLRSTNLMQWSLLQAILMPTNGSCTNLDGSSSESAVYYRAAWVP